MCQHPAKERGITVHEVRKHLKKLRAAMRLAIGKVNMRQVLASSMLDPSAYRTDAHRKPPCNGAHRFTLAHRPDHRQIPIPREQRRPEREVIDRVEIGRERPAGQMKSDVHRLNVHGHTVNLSNSASRPA